MATSNIAVARKPAANGDPGAVRLRMGGKLYPVETYADASEMVLAALAEYRGHYRDLPSIDLLNSRGKKCGHVSTNGKVWLGDCQVWPPRSMPTQIATV